MKNVLILSNTFPPAFNPRMGYLCKYLADFGWNPIIIADSPAQNIYPDLAKNHDITYINYELSENKFWQKIKYAFVFLADFLFDYKALVLKRKARKKIKQHHVSLILSSSSYRPYSALAACQLAKKYHIPFVMDLRDIFEQMPENDRISKKTSNARLNNFITKILTKRYLQQRNEILSNANAVTTVSEWHKDLLSAYNNNVHLIYNGFDPELFYPKIIKNEQFTISYTGSIEGINIKDPTLFFEAIANLFSAKKMDIKKINIQFYLLDEGSKKIAKTLAEKYKIADFIHLYDSVESSEVPKILNESSVLLLLANKSTGEDTPKGIMGTKFFEYLAVEKPILCVRNDEACLEKTIKSANAGISASSAKEIEKFLLEKYVEWQQNGYTHQEVSQKYIQQFSRKRQAEQFVELFAKTLNNYER